MTDTPSYTVPLPETKLNQQTRKRLGEAIYLLAYLIQKANWEKGALKVTHEKIAADTGFPERTIDRWMQALIEQGEIVTRRVIGGTLVQIVDYEAIARTRGVKYAPPPDVSGFRPGQAAGISETQNPETSRKPVPPRVAVDSAADGECIPPRTALESAADGACNIKEILSQTMGESKFQNLSSLSEEEGKRPALGPGSQTREDIFDYTDPQELKLAEARKRLSRMGDEERLALRMRAMESLERDPRPFLRIFVTRNESGELEPRGKEGPEMVLLRMGELRPG